MRTAAALAFVIFATLGAGSDGPETGVSIVLAAGDIASCTSQGDEATAALLEAQPGATVAALGDNVYETGTAAEFASCYHPSWGIAKERTRPVAGNHEYETPGAAGYYGYFGEAAGEPAKGYYSYELGDWHVVVLNTNCAFVACGARSAQELWLRADLSASNARCTLAYGHHPRFSSGSQHGSTPELYPLWSALYDHGVEIYLAGHEHHYERFAPQLPSGFADTAYGVRQFTVGTGGKSLYGFGSPLPNSEVRDFSASGVLELALGNGTYSWRFLPVAGQTFTDSGGDSCHDASPVPAPAQNLIANGHFEEGTRGWSRSQASLTTVAGGVDGVAAGRVAYAGTGTSYSIVTSRYPVTETVAGTAYAVSAAVRGAGTAQICVRLREWAAGAVVGSAKACRVPSASWGALAFNYTAHGGGSIDVYAYRFDSAPESSFDIDAVTLTATGVGPPADTEPPDTSIDGGPAGTVTETNASFLFSATESNATFECSLDGAPFASCLSPQTYSNLAASTHTFSVRARDAAGNVDNSAATRTWTIALPPPPPDSSNLLSNGNFEGSLAGWSAFSSTLSLVGGGLGGGQAARVALTGVGDNGYSIITSPRPVKKTTAGTVYRAGGSVRSSTGKRLCLRVREWSSTGALLGARASCVVPGASWTAFPSLTYTAVGGGSLDVYAYQSPAVAGDAFEVDGVTLATG